MTAMLTAKGPRAWVAPLPHVVLGVPIAPMTMAQAVDLCASSVASRQRLLIGVVNAAKIVNMQRSERLRRAVLAADVILADGMAVVWAARLLGRPLPERVAGIDLMSELLARGGREGWRVFLLGAERHVLEQVVASVARDCPGIVIAGARDGYFRPHEEPDVAEEIRAARPDVLLVAMSSPRKEEFLAKYADSCGAAVCHGVGGAFDVVAGRVRRAPRLWQKLGLEWFYRLAQEPRRLWRRYLETNTRFAWLLLKALLAESRRAETAGAPDS